MKKDTIFIFIPIVLGFIFFISILYFLNFLSMGDIFTKEIDNIIVLLETISLGIICILIGIIIKYKLKGKKVGEEGE